MEKYSCSYGGTAESFVLFNNNIKKKRTLNEKEYGLFSVIQNIIQRGMPSKPSIFLKESLGEIPSNLNPVYLISDTCLLWKNIIKGDDKQIDYPANNFFEKLLPEYLGEYAFVKSLIIPEADFADILEDTTVLCGQQVDFYFPQMRIVFEIDGYSHSVDSQMKKDSMRDTALLRNNIKVIRIKTEDIKKKTEDFAYIMKTLKESVANNPVIEKYKNDLTISSDDIRIKYDAIIRIQILIISCIKSGRLNFNDEKWNLSIQSSDVVNLEYLIELAYEDIKCWARNIAKLIKIDLEFPEISINDTDTNPSLIIDFGMFKRFTDESQENPECIYVRTDYYTGRNYYEVAFADTLQYQFHLEGEENDVPNLQFLLKNLFGFNEFRDGQLPIIMNVLERKDTIGILPTGTGKSLCYQFAAMLQPGVSIVVVPIISLMIDQKRSMDSNHMNRANYVTSQMTGGKRDKVLTEFQQGQYQVLWMSPERFQNEEFRKSLYEINKTMNFSLAVIDEVHCLSEWGHDFRVSYLTLIRTLRTYCPEACLLGLTATASQAVLEDLKVEFENDGSGIKALTSMNRDELIFRRVIVKSEMEKFKNIQRVIGELDDFYGEDVTKDKGANTRCGLVFCPTVNGKNMGCETISNQLKEWNRFTDRVGAYHGKLDNALRINEQNNFMDNKYSILVCTKAFGMGIDKSNIKYTIHCCMPQSIESFYQEAGRAGRDADKSEKSYCYILYSPERNIDNEEIQKIFRENISIDDRKNLCNNLKNDLSTIMYFWNYNRMSVEAEYQNISDVLKQLYIGETELDFNNSSTLGKSLENIQMALYKLSLLGIVESWTVNYHSLEQGVVDVIYTDCVETNIESHLLSYIRKYDPEFRLTGQGLRYETYVEMLQTEEKKITQLIKILIMWGNENILYQRLQSTYNMMELCNESVSDEEFRRRIDYYFRYSESSILFERIIYHPKEYENWFDLLFDIDDKSIQRSNQISKEKASNLLASLQRYLESYRNNTGLNFLSGMLRIYCGTYRFSEGVERIENSFISIKEMKIEEQNQIIEETLNFAKAFEVEEKDLLSEVLIRHYPNRIKQIFSILHDRYSLSIELDKSVQKLKSIMESERIWNI